MRKYWEFRIGSIPILPAHEKRQMEARASADEVMARVRSVTQNPGWFSQIGLSPDTRFCGRLRNSAFELWVCPLAGEFHSVTRLSGKVIETGTGTLVELTYSCGILYFLDCLFLAWSVLVAAMGPWDLAAVTFCATAGVHLFGCYNYRHVRRGTDAYLLRLLDATPTCPD
jgi:hypothetical protein